MLEVSSYANNKRFISIRTKLVLLFGSLILISGIALGLTALYLAKRALIQKVSVYLVEKQKMSLK